MSFLKEQLLINKSPFDAFIFLFERKPKAPSPLTGVNFKVFLIPLILILLGAIIWFFTLVYQPANFPLILLGEIIMAIGVFTVIILGFWVMTIVRIPHY